MKTTESIEDVEIEVPLVRAARLTFLGSLAFWPLFLFAVLTMLEAPGKGAAALVERKILIYGTWLYPVAVGLGWFLSKRGMRRGRSDMACLMPWLIPALVFGYWLVSFFL